MTQCHVDKHKWLFCHKFSTGSNVNDMLDMMPNSCESTANFLCKSFHENIKML